MAILKKSGKLTDDELRAVISESGLRHIAFIMDGNGRWATSRGLPREAGHAKGAAAFRHIVDRCDELGITTVTTYALSTENLKKRPKTEIAALMRLLDDYIAEAERDNEKNGISYNFIGEPSLLGEEMAQKCAHLTKVSAGCAKTLNIALNYGGRAEIARAASRLASRGVTEITEDMLSGEMYTAACPDPDLIVRTAGEYRISNFLLWQCAYAEFYYTDTLWPDFDDKALEAAILDFASRKRNFGGLKT